MNYEDIPRDYDKEYVKQIVDLISAVAHPELLLEDVALASICLCTKGYCGDSNIEALDELYGWSSAESASQLQNFESKSNPSSMVETII